MRSLQGQCVPGASASVDPTHQYCPSFYLELPPLGAVSPHFLIRPSDLSELWTASVRQQVLSRSCARSSVSFEPYVLYPLVCWFVEGQTESSRNEV